MQHQQRVAGTGGEAGVRPAHVILHYLVAAVLLTLFGRHVCAYANALPLGVWLGVLLPAQAVALWLRGVLAGRAIADQDAAPRRLFVLDWSLFAGIGALVGLVNTALLGLPVGSMAKVIVGCCLYGFFVAAETALGCTAARFASPPAILFDPPERFRPLWQRLVAAATVVTLGLGLVVFLLMVPVIEASGGDAVDLASLVSGIAAEMAVTVAVFLVLSVRLARLAAHALTLALDAQVRTLRAARAGDFGATARVGSADEVGLVSREINLLVARLAERTVRLAAAEAATVRALVSVAAARDDDTGRHLDRTSAYVRLLCDRLVARGALAPEQATTIAAAAPLHDIGKVGVRDAVLAKPGPLDEAEREAMRAHVALGEAAIVRALAEAGEVPLLVAARRLIAGHHERWDGTGYPRGLAGEAIPFEGRIMAVADVYDALRSARIYKPALGRNEAQRLMREGSGTQFDPALAADFEALEPTFNAIAIAMADPAPPGRDGAAESGGSMARAA